MNELRMHPVRLDRDRGVPKSVGEDIAGRNLGGLVVVVDPAVPVHEIHIINPTNGEKLVVYNLGPYDDLQQ